MTVKNVIQFAREVKTELSEVVWPTWNDWVGSTIVVLSLVTAFAIYLGLLDLVFSWLARMVFKVYGGY